MNPFPEKVIRYLTGYDNLEDVASEDLRKQAEEHPYFPLSQILLAKKLNTENTSDCVQQVQKTALYFPNPYLLQYFLSDEAEDVTYTMLPALEDENAHLISRQNSLATFANEPIASPQAEKETINHDESEREQTEQVGETETPETDNASEEPVSAEVLASSETTIAVAEEMAGADNAIAMETQSFLAKITSTDKEALAAVEEPGSEVQPEGVEMDEHERMFQNIKAMLDATSEEADADTENTVVPIDPYYTIDYFASQGIKLDLDRPQDHLGTQVKKFTQWLKHMKKLGPEDATEVIYRTEAEADIQQIADTSNIAREVVTEAMAQVLEKQGKNEKAIQLYNKLSFLNPHKSAYFAAKIKTLKGT